MGPVEYKEEGNRFFKEKLWDKAIEQYDKGLQESSGELPADMRGLLLSNRSQCWLNLENWDKAFQDSNACLQLLPEHTKSLYRRAQAFEKLGKSAEALADYAKVIRAEPHNQAAVVAAKRLREMVLKSGQQKRDETLPVNLLEILRSGADAGTDRTVEDKVDACAKLRGLCVHRGLTNSLLSSGALELLIEKAAAEDTPLEFREAALSTLVTMASGHEAEEDGEDAHRPPPPPTGPLPVPAGAAEVRKRLRSSLPLANLRRLCRMYPGATRHLAVLLGFSHEPEDPETLEAIHDALVFTEDGELNVPRAGVTALAAMFDTRRRLGKHGKPLVPTASLLKCLESALGTTKSADPLRSVMAGVFTLLADKDRPEDAKVDLAEVGLKILEPFLQSEDIVLKSNGLSGLAALLAASMDSATQMMSKSPAPFVAILNALQRPPHGPEGSDAQDHAIECMLLSAGDRKTRQHFIDGEGIEILLKTLKDGQEGSKTLVRAKLVAVLAIIAGHNKDIREEIFDRIDFLMELRHALDTARETARNAHVGAKGAPSVDKVHRLCRGLYESCACLTIHGEFKELLASSKKTLKAIHDLASAEDFDKDPQLAFLYATIMYNLCRSREDKVRPKKKEFPFNELDDDDLNALEEFYEKMPAESRPVKNGEIDPGSIELANQLRKWCVSQSNEGTQRTGGDANMQTVVASLAKCATSGSSRVKDLVAFVYKFLCNMQEHRKFIVAFGGIRALLGLIDLEDELARDAARQSLAQILIVINPTLLQYSEQLDSVRPLVQLLEHRHELFQFESAMGLTNLLTVSDELRTRALQADGWRACRDLLFSENERVQRAGIEAMCNLTMAPEVLERFIEGKYDLDIKIFAGFCHSDDKATRIAASGALAMLSSCEEVACRIAKSESFGSILESLKEAKDAEVQHRIVSAICGICEANDCPPEAANAARAAVRERRKIGFTSREADALALDLLDEGAISVGGA